MNVKDELQNIISVVIYARDSKNVFDFPGNSDWLWYWRGAVLKRILRLKKCKKAEWLSGEALQTAEKRREAKSKGEKEGYKHLNAEFQRITRRDKKAFFSDQCKEIEEKNRMGPGMDWDIWGTLGMVARPWSSSLLSYGERLLLRCDGNTGNSFPTTQGKDLSSRAIRRKRGSSGCGRDSRASSRVETGMSGNFLSCSKGVKDPLEVPEVRCD